jgi:hypothetical protein
MGAERIRRNLGLSADDVVEWCKAAVNGAPDSAVVRRGKNFYVRGNGFVITIIAGSQNLYQQLAVTGFARKFFAEQGGDCRQSFVD